MLLLGVVVEDQLLHAGSDGLVVVVLLLGVVVEDQSLQVEEVVGVVVVVVLEELGSQEPQPLTVVVVVSGMELGVAEVEAIKDNKETRVVLDPRTNDEEGMMLVGYSKE